MLYDYELCTTKEQCEENEYCATIGNPELAIRRHACINLSEHCTDWNDNLYKIKELDGIE